MTTSSWTDRLLAIGMSEASSREAAGAFVHASAALAALGQDPDLARALFVPGRLEFLGKHTDYAGGASIVAAVERGFAVRFMPRSDGQVRIVDAADGREARFPLAPDIVPPAGHWSNYAMTAARRLARNVPALSTGADIAFQSTLPKAAGMSSSSALLTAVFLVLSEVNRLSEHTVVREHLGSCVDRASFLGCVENGSAFGPFTGDTGVGTFGGSEDHAAILCSEAGRLGHFGFCPVRLLGRLPLPDGCTLVVATSGIAAEKTGNARDRYNRASELVSEAVRLWNEATGRTDATLAAAVASGPGAIGRLRELVGRSTHARFPAGALAARVEQFILENGELVPQAVHALVAGDVEALSRLVDRSQAAAEEGLGNQIPETIALARAARALGAPAASSFGAGFGGSVWALVPSAEAERFAEAWLADYRVRVVEPGARATAFVTPPGPPATFLR